MLDGVRVDLRLQSLSIIVNKFQNQSDILHFCISTLILALKTFYANPISWRQGKIDAFIAGLAYIGIGRCYGRGKAVLGMRRAKGGDGGHGGGCVDKEVRHGLGAAPLIRS